MYCHRHKIPKINKQNKTKLTKKKPSSLGILQLCLQNVGTLCDNRIQWFIDKKINKFNWKQHKNHTSTVKTIKYSREKLFEKMHG